MKSVFDEINKIKKVMVNQFKRFIDYRFIIYFCVTVLLIYFSFLSNNCCNNDRFLKYANETKQSTNLLSTILESQNCLSTKIYSSQALINIWPRMYFIVKQCSGKLFENLNIQELPNRNENKYFIIPNSFKTESCNVVTLGIGGDVGAEEKLLKLMSQCKFLGVDNGEFNKKLYKEKLSGRFIEGLVGAENGTYKASIMDKTAKYSEIVLPHYSFKYLISQYLNESLIDLLLMDIEGDEFALMEDIIENPQFYPIICQINVEFHDPFKTEKNVMKWLNKMIQKGPYLLVKVEKGYPFLITYLINVYEDACIKKYLIKY